MWNCMKTKLYQLGWIMIHETHEAKTQRQRLYVVTIWDAILPPGCQSTPGSLLRFLGPGSLVTFACSSFTSVSGMGFRIPLNPKTFQEWIVGQVCTQAMLNQNWAVLVLLMEDMNSFNHRHFWIIYQRARNHSIIHRPTCQSFHWIRTNLVVTWGVYHNRIPPRGTVNPLS